MRNLSRLVNGIGVKEDNYLVQIDGRTVKEYQLWSDMLRRCTEKFWKRSVSYKGVTCSENFKSYAYFYNWCQTQGGFKENFALDKDLLIKGNKVYSEDTCVFLPKIINQALITKSSCRGEYLIGVSFDKNRNKFQARCGQGKDTPSNLGRFATEYEAFAAYKNAKEAYIKKLANHYRFSLDPRAYQALLNYTVEITD